MAYLTATGPKLNATSPLPATGGYAYSDDDLKVWRARAKTGPFVKLNDFTKGSPGDLDRIRSNAAAFDSAGEPLPAGSGEWRFRHGTLARDRVFTARLDKESALSTKLVNYLVDQAKNPRNDFRSLCFVAPLGQEDPPDAYFLEGGWLYRYAITYDFAKPLLSSADRTTIENYLLGQAHFFAAHTDWYLAQLFPDRNKGSYSTKYRYAISTTSDGSNYFNQPLDINGDCKVDASESKVEYPIYTYVTGTGKLGPRVSKLARIYNNRRAAAVASFGQIGMILGEKELTNRAKRYYMEWLTYSIYPDGSQGEYERNGDYCIAKQGVIYSNVNTQTAMHFATRLQRQGDSSLLNFTTKDGLFGTETNGIDVKTFVTPVATAINLANQKLDWYYNEPWKAKQMPRANTHLGRLETNYMGSSTPLDSFNEVGLILGAATFPSVPLSGFILRDKATTTLRFPGATGNSVGTGGGTWTDALNSMPAVLFLKP